MGSYQTQRHLGNEKCQYGGQLPFALNFVNANQQDPKFWRVIASSFQTHRTIQPLLVCSNYRMTVATAIARNYRRW